MIFYFIDTHSSQYLQSKHKTQNIKLMNNKLLHKIKDNKWHARTQNEKNKFINIIDGKQNMFPKFTKNES